MNRPIRPAELNSTTRGQDTTEVIRVVNSLSILFRNDETALERAAIDAAAAGRPAFWTTATYHNSAARRFAQLANQQTVEAALRDAADAVCRPCMASSPEFLLCSLIPLNIAARNALEIVRGQRDVPSVRPLRAEDEPTTRQPRDFFEVPHCSATVREGQ